MNTIFTKKKDSMHIGHNIKRIREIQGIKQEVFGQLCRSRYSQQRISDFENMFAIDEPLLDELATALGVSPEFVKAFKDENVMYNIQNNSNSTFTDNAMVQHTVHNDGSDKLLVLLEKLLEEDRAKTQSIAELGKAVLTLAQEMKKMKDGS